MSASTPGEQATLSGFSRHRGCNAYADSTGELCERDPVADTPYCPLHLHLYDPELD